MKKCPACSRSYDDTWGICLHCQAPLVSAVSDGEKSAPAKAQVISFGDDFIGKQIKKSNRNLLLTNLAILGCLVWLGLSGAFSDMGYWILIVLAVYGLVFWNLSKFWARHKKPMSHPIIKVLSKIGPAEKLVPLINEETKNSKIHIDKIIITKSWLLKPSFYGMDLTLLGQLAWVHKKVTQRSVNFVPTGKDYAVVIYKRDGEALEVSCSEYDSNRLQDLIMKTAPWIVGGYSDELQALWDSKRSEFIAAVDQRKREAKDADIKMKGDNWVAKDTEDA